MDFNQKMINFIKLDSILLQRVCRMLRQMWLQKWKVYSGLDWSNTPKQGVLFVDGVGKSFADTTTYKFKKKLLSGDVNEWDATLLGQLLLIFDFGSENKLSWGQRSTIVELLNDRNYLAHHESNEVSDDEFKEKWLRIQSRLIVLNDSEEELKELTLLHLKEKVDLKNEVKPLEKNEKFSTVVDHYSSLLKKASSEAEKSELYLSRSNAYLKWGSENTENAQKYAQKALEIHNELMRKSSSYIRTTFPSDESTRTRSGGSNCYKRTSFPSDESTRTRSGGSNCYKRTSFPSGERSSPKSGDTRTRSGGSYPSNVRSNRASYSFLNKSSAPENKRWR